MASNYRAIVHYHLKKGMEEKGLRFLENELVKKGPELGCHYLELWQNEKDSSIIEGVAMWNTLDEAKKFQTLWSSKEKEFIHLFCTETPKREFCKLRHSYIEKARKAA